MLRTQPCILIHQLHYTTPGDKLLFQGLSLALNNEKVGLIGNNGSGKSSLLKLITGEILPDSGTIRTIGSLAYCPQELADKHQTVADIFHVSEKCAALSRIHQGSIDEKDYSIIGDDWLFAEPIRQHLETFQLDHLAFDQPLTNLSGGEKTKLMLAQAFYINADFMLLDEPTNHLDLSARHLLYEAITRWQKGLLVVSHDRMLLNLMDKTIELTSLGMRSFGGDYDAYLAQKTVLQQAAQHDLIDAKKALQKTKTSIQETREPSEQKRSQGRALFRTGKIDRLFANSQRGRSERTQCRLSKQNLHALNQVESHLEEAKSKIELSQEMTIELPKTDVPNGKAIVQIEKLDFSYTEKPLIHQFNLSIVGPERIALLGDNGSGKSTLVKLLLGKLQPQGGTITLGTNRIHYLDQHMDNILNPSLSILENFLLLNEKAKPIEAHAALATFLFKNTAALTPVWQLSGGEKLRAELACLLLSKQPPQLLILDEPTNHLDLKSIISIESALKKYQGALIVISHDKKFLDNIDIQRYIYAPYSAR